MLVHHLALRSVAATSAAALALALGAAAPASAKARPSPPGGTTPVLVAGGLIAPLHLAARPGGHEIYAVDGFLGEITEISLRGSATRTATIPSGIAQPSSIAFRGHQVWVVGSDDTSTVAARVTRSGQVRDRVDLLAFERLHNPDGQVPETAPPGETPPGEEPQVDAESNPYDVIAYHGGLIVADAAANALIRIAPNGDASVLTAFPLVTRGAGFDLVPCAQVFQPRVGGTVLPGCDPVPTGIALGPDGYLYVSGLGSFAAGQVWKVDPRTGAIVDTITDDFPVAPPFTEIAVGDDGAIYVASPFAGAVFRLLDGQLSVLELPAAVSLLVSHGTLYVGTAPAVVSEDPTAEPAPGAVYAVPAGAFVPFTP